MKISFEHSYASLDGDFYSEVEPAKAPAPKLIAWNKKLANELGIDNSNTSEDDLAQNFSGKKIPVGAKPIAVAYGGHQFGHFNILGDGRAHLLGEVLSKSNQRFDVQLKGSGQTPYSRNGDGKSSLGPVIREYILSEAMHALGVPSTRALAAVTTGETVHRQEGLVPGGVFTRVASSHIRVGSFEYFYAKKDIKGSQKLLDYTIKRHFPELLGSQNLVIAFIQAVIARQAKLVAQWMNIGFIHGVMNTDNMSVAGITIDYGPCAFMDHFNFHQVYSFIDRNGRYAYNAQLAIAQWNLSRFAESLWPLIDSNQEKAVAKLNTELSSLGKLFDEAWISRMAAKFGLSSNSEEVRVLIIKYLEFLQQHSLDYTNSFRALSKILTSSTQSNDNFFPNDENFDKIIELWKQLIQKENSTSEEIVSRMNSHNPVYIPRNHQVEKAIQAAYKEDYSYFHRLNEVLSKPFEERTEFAEYLKPPEAGEIVENTFCGT